MSAINFDPHTQLKPQLSEMVAVEIRHVHRPLRRFISPVLYTVGATLGILVIAFGTYVFWEHIRDGYSYGQIVSSDIGPLSSTGNSLTSKQPAKGTATHGSSSPSVTSSRTITQSPGGSSGSSTNGNSGGGNVPNTFAGIEVPASIIHDCSVNVSAELNAWLASVPDGSTLGFNGGCFRIDQTLFVKNRGGLTFDGQDATFKAVSPTGDSSSFDAQAQCAGGSGGTPSKAARTRSQWQVDGSSGITFQNMTVYGANPCGGTGSPAYVAALEAQHAFDIDGGNANITIHNVQAYDTYGDFIYFRGTSNGHVFDCHFERNGRQGISVTSGGPILIENDYIANTRRATVDLEPNTSSNVVDGVTIRNNTVGAGRLLFVASHGSGPVNDVVVENNKLTRCMSISVQGSASLRRHSWTVQNNVTTGGCGSPAPGAPIGFSYVDQVRVLNNVQPIQKDRGDNGVNISYVTDIQVNGNSFVNAVAALYGYNNWTGDSGYSSCGNQLVQAGAYDQPVACSVSSAEDQMYPRLRLVDNKQGDWVSRIIFVCRDLIRDKLS